MYGENGWEHRRSETTSMLVGIYYLSVDIPVLVEWFPGLLWGGNLERGKEEKVPVASEWLDLPLSVFHIPCDIDMHSHII